MVASLALASKIENPEAFCLEAFLVEGRVIAFDVINFENRSQKLYNNFITIKECHQELIGIKITGSDWPNFIHI